MYKYRLSMVQMQNAKSINQPETSKAAKAVIARTHQRRPYTLPGVGRGGYSIGSRLWGIGAGAYAIPP